MDGLNEDVTETKTIDSLTSNNFEIQTDIDLDPVELAI